MIKKGLGCVLALCMLCSVALAQFSDGPVAEIEGTDWRMLEEANLLAKFEGDLMFLCDLQGNKLSEGYNMVTDRDGYILVSNGTDDDKVWGVLNLDGSVVIPASAKEISIRDGYINVENADGTVQAYGPDGVLLDVVPSEVFSFRHIPEVEYAPKANSDWNHETKLYALTDLEGNLLTDYLYYYIADYDLGEYDYCIIKAEDYSEGLIKYTGEEIFAPVYKEILDINYSAYETCGIFAAWRDDVIAFSQNGTLTEIPVENVDDVDFYGKCVLVEYEDDSFAIAWPDGTLNKLAVDDCDVYMVGDQIFFVTDEEDPETLTDYTVLYDEEMNELLRTEWMMYISDDGHVLLNEYNGTCYVYDLK